LFSLGPSNTPNAARLRHIAGLLRFRPFAASPLPARHLRYADLAR
jgi:hypothetical protein